MKFVDDDDNNYRHLVISLHAKYEVSSSNRSRDTEKVPKFQK